jgi:hypothetical protein
MVLDLEVERIKATLRRLPENRVKLTIEYPSEPYFRNKVLSALSDLIRPTEVVAQEQSEAAA